LKSSAGGDAEEGMIGPAGEAAVTTFLISFVVAVLAFGAGLVGLALQKRLPDDQVLARSRDMIGAVIGLVTLLLALVLGTLIGSAYGFYATQKSELEALSARAILLDTALAEFGPETQAIRAELKQAITHAYDTFWRGRGDDPQEHAIAAYLPGFKAWDFAIASLNPTTPVQKQSISTIATDLGILEQTRLLLSLQLASPVPWPLLIIVVSWAVLLFCGFGVLSHDNVLSVAVLGFGAFAVASAVLLILGLNDPYTGLFQLPGATFERAIAALGQ